MNLSLLWRHRGLLVVFFICLSLPFLLMVSYGLAKDTAEYSWTDVVGEGSVALLTILWLLTALASRPPGLVTRLLVIGLACFMFSSLLDVIDEFVRYSPQNEWISIVESIPAGIGMIVMSAALYLWHLEQLALNKQLQRRELTYRSFEQIDFITQLYRVDYLRERVYELQQRKENASLVVLDINNFSELNRKFGDHEGDRFLKEIADLILMNLRPCDLACRYAGDRFVILMPNTNIEVADGIAVEVKNSVSNVAFKVNETPSSTTQSLRSVVQYLTPEMNLHSTLAELNKQLDKNSHSVTAQNERKDVA